MNSNPITSAPLRILSPRGSRARLLIFTYHRVLERQDPLLPDEAHALTFERQMDWLGSYCRVLPLAEAVTRLVEGTLPDRAACITFDDGYANNHDIAVPILLRRGLPATFYVTIDAVERGIMWNDLVIEAVRNRGCSSAEAVRQIATTLEQLKYLPLEERWMAAADLYAEVGDSTPPRLMMSADMVRSLAAAGFEIGAHTVNHPILAQQTQQAARREILDSRDWITSLLGAPPKSFAYPNGRPGRDYDETHARMVQEAGFESAVSTYWSCARAGTDRYQLPRVSFWDHTSTRFWLRIARTYVESYRH